MKQVPRLAPSTLTDRIYIVTQYEEHGDGIIVAIEKFDVTEQFDALIPHRKLWLRT